MAQDEQKYGAAAQAFHWLTAALVFTQLTIGWIMPDIKRGMVPGDMMSLHMSIGMLILAVVLLRVLWRLAHGTPAPDASLPPWQRRLSQAVHLLLYLLIFAMVFTGWSFASMRGWTISIFGLARLPALFAEGSAAGHTVGELHGVIVWALVATVAVHGLAALAHYFVYRDRILQRMLPRFGDTARRST